MPDALGGRGLFWPYGVYGRCEITGWWFLGAWLSPGAVTPACINSYLSYKYILADGGGGVHLQLGKGVVSN